MLVYIDTETTGLETNDRICSIGIISDQFSHYEVINPGKKIPPSASAIHHITNEMIKEASVFAISQSSQLLQEVNTFENILVSHNAPFELSMLSKEGIVWQGKVIDTLKCAKLLMDDLEGYSLQFLRYELRLYRTEQGRFADENIEITAHHALSDAMHTKMVLEYLLDLASLDQLCEISQNHVLLTRLPFGKYAKKRIEEISLKDPSYLKWMVESLMDMDEDLRYSIDYYLRKI